MLDHADFRAWLRFRGTYHLMARGRKNHLNFIARFYLLVQTAGIEPGPPAHVQQASAPSITPLPLCMSKSSMVSTAVSIDNSMSTTTMELNERYNQSLKDHLRSQVDLCCSFNTGKSTRALVEVSILICH